MRIFSFIIILYISCNAIAQDYTGLYQIAINKYIQYYDSTNKQTHKKQFLVIHQKDKYVPSQVGNYSIDVYDYKTNRFIKELKKLDKIKKQKNNSQTIDFIFVSGIYHFEDNSLAIVINEVYTYYDRNSNDWDFGNRSIIQFLFKYDCDSNKYSYSSLSNFMNIGIAEYDEKYRKVFPYKQKGKTLYDCSLILFIDGLKQQGILNDSLAVHMYDEILFHDERAHFFYDKILPDSLHGLKIRKLDESDRRKLSLTLLPHNIVKQVVYESDGVLIYNYKYVSMLLNKDKFIDETSLFESNYYYKYNCATNVYDLIKSDFVKIK